MKNKTTATDDSTKADEGQGAAKTTDTPVVKDLSPSEQEKQKGLDDTRQALEERHAAEKAQALAALHTAIAGLEQDKVGLTKQVEELTKRAEAAERDRDQFRAILQQEKVGTINLESGQAQLLESVTLRIDGSHVPVYAGDILLRDGPEKAVAETRARVGKSHRVFAVDAAQFDEVVAAKLATVRA